LNFRQTWIRIPTKKLTSLADYHLLVCRFSSMHLMILFIFKDDHLIFLQTQSAQFNQCGEILWTKLTSNKEVAEGINNYYLKFYIDFNNSSLE